MRTIFPTEYASYDALLNVDGEPGKSESRTRVVLLERRANRRQEESIRSFVLKIYHYALLQRIRTGFRISKADQEFHSLCYLWFLGGEGSQQFGRFRSDAIDLDVKIFLRASLCITAPARFGIGNSHQTFVKPGGESRVWPAKLEAADTGKNHPMLKLFRWLLAVIRTLCLILLLAWGTLAIYYNLPWAWARLALAVVFFIFGIWALWYSCTRRAIAVFAALFLGLLVWFTSIKPSHDRPWRPEVAAMPRAFIDGDRVRITGVRNFEYRSRDDFTVRYEEREVSLSHLNSLDFYLSYWMPGPIAHTFLSFGFDNAPPVSISIEARPEIGESFEPVASLFKQFELIYIVGDERDLVRVRTNYRKEDVFLYRIRISPEFARQLFLVYLERINELADRPEFYHLLSNNCTINIVRYANIAGRVGRFDIRHILSGLADRYLYSAGVLDTSLPFEELRRRSNINEAAQAAGNAKDFSERIRKSLPTPAP